jgi:hypothetical protein
MRHKDTCMRVHFAKRFSVLIGKKLHLHATYLDDKMIFQVHFLKKLLK